MAGYLSNGLISHWSIQVGTTNGTTYSSKSQAHSSSSFYFGGYISSNRKIRSLLVEGLKSIIEYLKNYKGYNKNSVL